MSIESQAQPVILVIDPDPLTMMGIAAALHLAGYECHCARDREAALKAADQHSMDLVISDVQVGPDNGLTICSEIRKRHQNRDVSLMFVSAQQTPDIVRRSHDDGGVYYLRKPFDPDVLLELVDRAMWMPHLVRNKLNQDRVHQPSTSSAIAAPHSSRIVPSVGASHAMDSQERNTVSG